jgi:L-alanine-DL-glutamate epimerase-like enolase superfamily enzyme
MASQMGLAAGPVASAAEPGRRPNLKVTDVQVLQVTGKSKRRALYLKILTDSGIFGLYGPIDNEAGLFVERFFKRPLIGQDPLAQEAYWDRMFRADRHSRGSHYLIGLSAVDNALWDLRGRLFGLPVYRLLGGSRKTVQAYASCLGFSQEPSALQAKARELKEQGYRHQKWFVRDRGPRFGPQGVEEDVKVVRLTREAVGDDVDLMFDAFWQWDLQYALAWARRAEPYRPRWIEEPFQTASLDTFIEFSRETSIPVATGEHFYGRWDVHEFLKAEAITVVQADPEWCGGVSELVKICTLASVHGVNVIPHGHSLHAAMHVVASQPLEVCPLVVPVHGMPRKNLLKR